MRRMSILICYDGSASAKHLLAVTEKVVGNAPAVLLHVWSPPERVLADAFADRQDDGGPTYEELETWVKERAAHTLDEGQTLAKSLGLTLSRREVSVIARRCRTRFSRSPTSWTPS